MKRIQRKRTKGWKMPANTVYVGRPTKYGNPYKPSRNRFGNIKSREDAITAYENYLKRLLNAHPDFLDDLKGKDLACWCPLDKPCHADVLLKLLEETMSLKQKVICLVGSTKPEWRQKYREVLEKLTLMGNAVFTVVWFRGDFQGDFEARRELMEQVHYLKIRASDAVVCISKEAIGEHTQMEMAYARSLGKPVYFVEDLK